MIALLRTYLRPYGWQIVLVLALLLLQVGIGETQYHSGLPWWLVLVHVAAASVERFRARR